MYLSGFFCHYRFSIRATSIQTIPYRRLNLPVTLLRSVHSKYPAIIYETLFAITGKPIPKFVQSIFVSGFNLLYTALSGCFFFIILIQLGKSKRDAFIYANILIFCSEMLQYSSTGWSEPAALCWGLLGFVLLLTKSQWILWALCAFAASLVRMEYIAFFIFFLIIHFLYKKTQRKLYILPFVIICSVMLLHMWFNYYRFGSAFNFGYFGQKSSKSTSIIISGVQSARDVISRFFSKGYFRTLYRTYISFGRVHWFWVSPLLVFSPLILFYKKIPLAIKITFTAACFELIIIAAMGNNSWCWGNRYLYTTFPYLLLPVFFLPFKMKSISTSFKIVSVTGFFISTFASLVNSHYVQELLVDKYGYQKAMRDYSSNLFTAPFWLHVKLFPQQFVNTAGLMIKGSNLPSWEMLRTDCLDLWPVGMCGAGINSFVSFGLWFALIGITIFFGFKIVRPIFFKYQTL